VTMAPEGYELFRRVQQAAEGTPYVVTETEKGFDVTLDVVDAQWYGLFNKAGLKKLFTHHVSVPESGTYSITDDARTVEWVAGTPRTGATAERQIGRIKEVGFQKIWAFDEHGRFGKVADYSFSSEEGRELITGIADAMGLQQRRGAAEKAGLTVGLLTLALLAIGGVVVLVLWLTGAFG
jgi:hypothetical protein